MQICCYFLKNGCKSVATFLDIEKNGYKFVATFLGLQLLYSFNVSRADLSKHSKLANRTINTWFNWLIQEKKYVTLTKQGSGYQRKANEYAIPLVVNKDCNNKPISIEINDLNIRELYNQIIT